MSDTDRLALRQLPPVEPVERPRRLSQTFLRHADRCMRAAYLYLKYSGGTPAVPLDFGTAFHLFAERALLDMIVAEEKTLYAAQEGDPGSGVEAEDPRLAARAVASLTGAMCDEILREHPELTLPARGDHSRDALRQLAYHFAIGSDIDPEQVVAVERKFVLDLESGWTVSGKIDVASISADDPRYGSVDDYKTTFAIPNQGDFEELFQLRLYVLLLVFGNPVEPIVCPSCKGVRPDASPIRTACSTCDGHGYTERRLPPLGSDLQWIRAREIYPRLLGSDGFMRDRRVTLSRQEVVDWKHDLEEQSLKVAGALETWLFPAVPGSHCNECPCRAECPLPAHVRRHAGTIETVEQAEEAAQWVDVTGAQVTATRKEIKSFANIHGPFRFGRDQTYEFSETEKWTTAWEELEVAVERATRYGEPFDLADHRRRTVSTSFRSRKLTAEELEPVAVEDTEVHDGESRFGEDPPF